MINLSHVILKNPDDKVKVQALPACHPFLS